MEFVDYINARNRMTKECSIHCDDCPLGGVNNGLAISCRVLEIKYPDVAVSIVEKWAKEHQAKTRQSEFLKVFPNAEVSLGYIDICPRIVNKEFKCPNDTQYRDWEKACRDCRKNFWLEEIEDDKICKTRTDD